VSAHRPRVSAFALVALLSAGFLLCRPALGHAQDDDALSGFDGESSDESEVVAQDEDETELQREQHEESEESEADAASIESPESEALFEDPETDPAEADASDTRALGFRASIALGMGTLSFTRPTAEGIQRLGETPFAAAGLDLALTFSPKQSFSFDVLFAYQSSIAFSLRLEPLFALPERVSVRYQRMELSLAPTFLLGDSPESLALAVPVGIAYRAFLAETHQYERLEQYVMAGPFLRAELLAWLGERVKLRLGPELQWIGYVEADFAGGSTCCQGIAAAGQGAIEARVGPIVSVALSYRESRAFVSSSRRFEDVERWLLAHVAGAF
jgi:hypothetical protein